MQLRERIATYLEDIEAPTGRTVNLSIAGLVLLSSAIFVAETYSISPKVRQLLDAIDTGILVIFAIEYLLRLWIAHQKVRYFFSLYALIDLASILPFFLGLTDIRFIRVFRWFRILRLIRFFRGSTIFGHITREDDAIVTRILFTLFTIIFVFSGLIYQTEHPVNPQNFTTFLDAVYFSVATMTTVGFGDIAPHSEIGRALTVLMILTGIALIPWQVGDLIKRLVKTGNQVTIPCSNCGLALHDADAQFCKSCGKELPGRCNLP